MALCMGVSMPGFAQVEDNVLDKVIAVVGDEVVLKSDLESQYYQMVSAGYAVDENTRCRLFEDQLFQALLLHSSKVDSIEVSDEQVDDEMNRRMRYFINQLGSEKKLEEFYQKSIAEIKEDLRSLIKDQLLIQKMQQDITANVKATPAEVRAYFHTLPKDSLPLVESEVEIAQIVRKPVIDEVERQKVISQLEEWRTRILKGEDFGTFAFLYSQDPGSKDKEGELGFVSRGTVVPEFAAVAFNLKPGEISEVVETEYGFHIIQLIERRGDQVNVRHILRKPVATSVDLAKARNYLDSITNIIRTVDTMDFATGAYLFSDDKDTRNNGGKLINRATGTSMFTIDELNQADPGLFFTVDKLEVGEISKPNPMQAADGSQAYRIVKLLKRTAPHRANLEDDYQKIQMVAEAEKKNKRINAWINKQASRTFINISAEYKDCKLQHDWILKQP
ncbi:MAG: peptidylprolyl isomerase [Flavobacteriales bacterium]